MLTSTAPLVEAAAITRYIPHRPPFVLVDTLYSCGVDGAVAGFHVTDNPMVFNGFFTEAGLIEHMAQSVALRAGWLGSQPGQAAAFSMGYIAGIKNARIYQLAPVGATILTRVRILINLGNMVLIDVDSHVGGQLLAECQLQLFHES